MKNWERLKNNKVLKEHSRKNKDIVNKSYLNRFKTNDRDPVEKCIWKNK